ncbi:MAG: nitroreductase family protein [Tannerella sp.]|nr:nitroreductase family protein [Tannerella sp.]
MINKTLQIIRQRRSVRDYKAEQIKEEHFNCLYGAPTLIIVSCDERTVAPETDCAAATQNLLIAAESIGLGSCWIKFVVIIFSAVLLTTCSRPQETPFNQFGLSFTCPAGWKVSDTEDYGNGCYLFVEKTGINTSGVLTVGMVEVEYDELTEYLSVYRELLESQPMFSQLKFEKVTEGSYGNYQGIVTRYTANVLTLAHEGRIAVFSANGKTICIIEQEATEDKNKNKTEFKTIEDSFSVGKQLDSDEEEELEEWFEEEEMEEKLEDV